MSLIKTRLLPTSQFIFPAILFVFVFSAASFASTIQGFVFDKNRTPLAHVDVELLNENYQMRGRAKTDGMGRYMFTDLSDGRYTIRVLPFRYDLEEQSASVEITTLAIRGTGQGNMTYTQDFFLVPKRGGLTAAETAVVFAQDVPSEARSLYNSAVNDLSNERYAEGIKGLRNAIALFPKYFDAIHRLGKELYIKGEYGEAAQLMINAAEINPKSPMSLFFAGSSLYGLGPQYYKSAIVALNESLKLAPASVPVLFLLGKLERAVGDVANAEKHLMQAKKLSKLPTPEIHIELSQLYGNDLKKFEEAANELELYLKASKPSAEDEKRTRQVITSLRQKAKSSTSTKP